MKDQGMNFLINVLMLLAMLFAIVFIAGIIYKNIKRKARYYIKNIEANNQKYKYIKEQKPRPVENDAIFIEWFRKPERKEEQSQYTKKKPMTHTEIKLYFRLVEALENYIILAQVQMSSFLEVNANNRSEYYTNLNKILMKSVDFLVLDKTGKDIIAIELQDWTHKRKDRIKSDEFKRKTLKAAGIPLIEFHAEALPSPEEIKEALIKCQAEPLI
jgi:hypothetical protein